MAAFCQTRREQIERLAGLIDTGYRRALDLARATRPYPLELATSALYSSFPDRSAPLPSSFPPGARFFSKEREPWVGWETKDGLVSYCCSDNRLGPENTWQEFEYGSVPSEISETEFWALVERTKDLSKVEARQGMEREGFGRVEQVDCQSR